MSDTNADYLTALDELRAERDQLHPHRPQLPERHLRSVPPLPPGHRDPGPFELDEETIELGRRRIAEMRALIAQHQRYTRRPPA